MHRIDTILLTLLLLLSLSCGREYDVRPSGTGSDRTALVFPDYQDVTIPCNIAPLNFYYTDPDDARFVTTFTAGGTRVTIKGREAVWKQRRSAT